MSESDFSSPEKLEKRSVSQISTTTRNPRRASSGKSYAIKESSDEEEEEEDFDDDEEEAELESDFAASLEPKSSVGKRAKTTNVSSSSSMPSPAEKAGSIVSSKKAAKKKQIEEIPDAGTVLNKVTGLTKKLKKDMNKDTYLKVTDEELDGIRVVDDMDAAEVSTRIEDLVVNIVTQILSGNSSGFELTVPTRAASNQKYVG